MITSRFNKTYLLKNQTSVIIREASRADAAAMIELALSVFNSSPHTLTAADEFNLTVDDEIKVIEEYTRNPGYIYLLAEQDNKLIGMLNFWNGKRRKNAHTGELAMGIHPVFRNLGLGTILLENLIDWAEKNPLIRKVSLAVFINNSNAIHLYKNLGFMEEGRKRKEIKTAEGEFLDLVLMTKFV